MSRTSSVTAAAVLLFAAGQSSAGEVQAERAPAVHDMSAHHAAMETDSPYSGEQERAVKAISEAERQELLGGHGMGLAKPAELNHYPGPRHVLDLASDLALTGEQESATQAIFDSMHEGAVALGQQILEQETLLDDLFREARVDEVGLTGAVETIGRLRAELRLVHLRAHLAMRELLSGEQIEVYDRLRGYE